MNDECGICQFIFLHPSSFNQLEFPRSCYRFFAAADAEFAVDVVDVGFDGAGGHNKLVGDFAVAVASGNQAEHFQFTDAEGIGEGGLEIGELVLSLAKDGGLGTCRKLVEGLEIGELVLSLSKDWRLGGWQAARSLVI